jgi:hypothetical protein
MEKLVEAVTEELNRYSGVPPFGSGSLPFQLKDIKLVLKK